VRRGLAAETAAAGGFDNELVPAGILTAVMVVASDSGEEKQTSLTGPPSIQRHQTKFADPGIGIVKHRPIEPSTGVAEVSLAEAVDAPMTPRLSAITVAPTEPAILVNI
jgi:hypothetical protein